ncbi:MAG: DUF6273 domain-containing protein [Phascolarctobacterium sp.]|nr:DUF6273 domain-containing protein [Phascolarctobacterium sp.]
MIKFNLYCDGQPIRSLEDLRENFNIDDIYEDYKSGKLVKWLQSRNYEREYIQIERINSKDKKAICDKLCVILGVAGANVESPRDLNESDIENRFLKLENVVAQLQQKFNGLETQIKDDRIKTNRNSAANNANVAVKSCLVKNNIKVGDVIKFGKYPQRKPGSLEAIEWQVLAVEGERALLISKFGLDAVPFDTDGATNKWVNCYLRFWLNDIFFKIAFSGEEAKQIATTNVDDIISDKLFLLNIDEVNKYFISRKLRECKATDQAKANGAYTYLENCYWWLRTAGDFGNYVAFVEMEGYVGVNGCEAYKTNVCVRPALWINI